MSKTADTSERQGSLGVKGVSQRTLHPCSLCNVSQSADPNEVGGELGDRDYDVVKNRRTRREVEHGWSRLLKMGFGTPQAVELSKQLGIVEPGPSSTGALGFDVDAFTYGVCGPGAPPFQQPSEYISVCAPLWDNIF